MAIELFTETVGSPHGGMPICVHGEPIESARLVIVLLHGRGGSAADMLGLADHLDLPGAVYLAPQAAGSSWYPASFLAPIQTNQPGIDSAHGVVEALIKAASETIAAPPPIALFGFSQGACLAVDHAYRFPRKYAFVAAMTGGLIGPEGSAFEGSGSLEHTPVFLGASDPDPHVPWARVEQTARTFSEMDAIVELVRYQNAPHTILPEQIQRVRELASVALREGGP